MLHGVNTGVQRLTKVSFEADPSTAVF